MNDNRANLGDYIQSTHTCYRQHEKYKERIRAKFNYTCQLCGKPGRDVDHIIPFAISHDSSPLNLRVLCHQCNVDTRRARKDANLPLEQWYESIKTELERVKEL